MEDSNASPGFASLGLRNRLLEVAVVAGMDEESDLHVRNMRKTATVKDDADLFEENFKPFLLDIIAGPQDLEGKFGETGGSNYLKQSIDLESVRRSLKKSEPAVTESRNQKNKRAIHRRKSIHNLRKAANKKEEVPVSTDFLRNLPNICLPDNSKVFRRSPLTMINHSVLTDISGKRHYASILVFYRQFTAEKVSNTYWSLSKLDKKTATDTTSCYVPCCVCLVSPAPYFDTFKDILSCMLREINISPKSGFRRVIEKYVTNLSLVVMPSPNILVRFNLGSFPLTLLSTSNVKTNQTPDFDLRIPLFLFANEYELLLKVLACIMLEQRIVFLSHNYSFLTLFIESLLCFIKPFEWPHQYIPVLFSEIIDFVDCPGIFLMGCHSCHKHQIEQVENDLYVVDLDEVKVYQPHSSTENDGTQFLLQLPTFAKDKLIRRIPMLSIYKTLHDLNTQSAVTLEEIREHAINSKMKINKKIQKCFMDLMVDIFGTTLYYLNYETQQFKMNDFLESISATDLPFYLKVTKTYLFRRFIAERLKHVRDDFDKFVNEKFSRSNSDNIREKRNFKKIRSLEVLSHFGTSEVSSRSSVEFSSSYKESFMTTPNAINQRTQSFEHIISEMNEDPLETTPQICIVLPSFPVQGTNFDSKNFFRRCVEVINEMYRKFSVETINSPKINAAAGTIRAGLILMRGLYKLGDNSLLQGLEDLHATAKEDASIFPEKLICEVIQALNSKELDKVKKCGFYIGDSFYKKEVMRGRRHQSVSVFSEQDLPLLPQNRDMFLRIVEKCDILTDADVVQILFDSLAHASNSDMVEHDVFLAFYRTWQQIIRDCEIARLSIFRTSSGSSFKRGLDDSGVLKIGRNEHVLKISGTVNSSKGTGRLILTTSRLIYMSSSNEDNKVVVELSKVILIKPSKIKSLFSSSIPALLIHYQGFGSSEQLKVGLKSDCELWTQIINEVKMGIIMHKGYHDNLHDILPPAAKNVLVADALFTTAKDEGYLSTTDVLTYTRKICNIQTLAESGKLQTLSEETVESLQLRIDPTPKETKKPAVIDVVYSSAGIEEIPQVWVGLHSGKIRRIDTTQWALDPIPVQDCPGKLSCMCLVNRQELWVGMEKSMIYCISTIDMKKARILHDHTTSVVSIIAFSSCVVSGSSNGEIIVWKNDMTTYQRKFKIIDDDDEDNVLLTMSVINENEICCGTKKCIDIRDLLGNVINTFVISRSGNDKEIVCVTHDGSKEIWAGDNRGMIYMWNIIDRTTTSNYGRFTLKHQSSEDRIIVPTCVGMLQSDISNHSRITSMLYHYFKIWVGNEDGEIRVLSTHDITTEKVLKAHSGPVLCLCQIENRYVLSGAGGKDGKIVAWRV